MAVHLEGVGEQVPNRAVEVVLINDSGGETRQAETLQLADNLSTLASV
jgi:hypothetical protein